MRTPGALLYIVHVGSQQSCEVRATALALPCTMHVRRLGANIAPCTPFSSSQSAPTPLSYPHPQPARAQTMFEKILLNSRYLTYLTVILTLFCALVLYLVTTIAALTTIYQSVMYEGWEIYSVKTLAASFLKIVDFFLIATGLQIIALGIYKLFVNNSIELPEAMGSQSFSELKLTLVKLASIVLLLDFVEHAFRSGPSQELMEYGIAIGVVLLAVSWGSKQLMYEGNN